MEEHRAAQLIGFGHERITRPAKNRRERREEERRKRKKKKTPAR